MAHTFTGLKLQGQLGKFGKTEISDIEGYVELPDGKVGYDLVSMSYTSCCSHIGVKYSIIHLRVVHSFYILKTQHQNGYFFVACLTCTPDSIELVKWGTWHRCQHWDSIVEWRNLVAGDKLHWS